MMNVKNTFWPTIVNAETLEADRAAVVRRTTTLSFAVFATSAALCYLAPTRGRVLLGLAATAITAFGAERHFDAKSHRSARDAREVMVEKATKGLKSETKEIPDDAQKVLLAASETMRVELVDKLSDREDWINLWFQVCQNPALVGLTGRDALLSKMFEQVFMGEDHDKSKDCYKALFKCESNQFFIWIQSYTDFDRSFAFNSALELDDLSIALQERHWNYFAKRMKDWDLWKLAFKTDFAILENNDKWEKLLKEEYDLDNYSAGTRITEAVQNKHAKILEALLKNPNLDINKEELCVYECWVEARSLEITNLLKQYNFNPNASRLRGHDALQGIIANQPDSYPKDFSQEQHVQAILDAGASNLEEALKKCTNENLGDLIKTKQKALTH